MRSSSSLPVVAIIALVAVAFIKEVPLRTTLRKEEPVDPEREPTLVG